MALVACLLVALACCWPLVSVNGQTKVKPANQHCYLSLKERMDYDEAMAFCTTQNMQLVSMETETLLEGFLEVIDMEASKE